MQDLTDNVAQEKLYLQSTKQVDAADNTETKKRKTQLLKNGEETGLSLEEVLSRLKRRDKLGMFRPNLISKTGSDDPCNLYVDLLQQCGQRASLSDCIHYHSLTGSTAKRLLWMLYANFIKDVARAENATPAKRLKEMLRNL